MTSPFMAALEKHKAETELESEYSYFIRINNEQLDDILQKFGDCEREVFSESKLKSNKELDLNGRIRQYNNADGAKFELTTKGRGNDSKTKIESEIEIDQMNYNMLLANAISTVVRVRLNIPLTWENGEQVVVDEEELEWELDLYIDARHLDSAQSTGIHPWVKLELEVPKITVDSVESLIPFDYEEIVESDTNNELERALIKELYEDHYNVQGKLDVTNLDSLIEFS